MSQIDLTHYRKRSASMTDEHYRKKGFGKSTLWLDFVNSLEHDGLGHTTDYLRNPAWREAFLRFWKLPALAQPAAPLPELTQLRTLLRSITDRLSHAKAASPQQLRSLNRALSVFARPQLIQRQNGLQWKEIPQKENWRWIAAEIAKSCAKTLVHSPLDRVKTCPDPQCRWVFYDQTKAKSRRWCSETTCGNRNRVRRARAADAIRQG